MMKKSYIYSILAALFLAVVAFLFFFPDDIQGMCSSSTTPCRA